MTKDENHLARQIRQGFITLMIAFPVVVLLMRAVDEAETNQALLQRQVHALERIEHHLDERVQQEKQRDLNLSILHDIIQRTKGEPCVHRP